MDIVFDSLNGVLQLGSGDSSLMSHGDNFYFKVKLDENLPKISLKNKKFGITVTVNMSVVLDKQFPEENVKYYETDQELLFSCFANWLPDDEVNILAWVVDENEQRYEDRKLFISPKPPKPFPSWVWFGTEWVPPVPYPDDMGEVIYDWDEENTQFIVVEQ